MRNPFNYRFGLPSPFYDNETGSFTPFSPASLFSSNEPGVWYDPSDLTTLFQDVAGTIPVTDPGQTPAQTVALMLDKSKGLTLGSELITPVANQDFSSDTGYWVKGSGVTISGGKANFAASSGYVLFRGSLSGVAVGGYYEIVFTISDYVSGSIQAYVGSTPAFGPSVSANGTYTVRLGPIAGSEIGLRSLVAFTGSIDNISVKAVTGNHATQATAASRPTYGVVPLGGRRNLLTQTEAFSESVWTKLNATVTANSTVAPDGTTTADTITDNATSGAHYAQVLNAFVADGLTRFWSIYVKQGTARYISLTSYGLDTTASNSTRITFDMQDGVYTSQGTEADTVLTPVDVGSGWWRIGFSSNTNNSQFDNIRIEMNSDGTNTGSSYSGTGSTAFIWGAQLELGSTATAYQRVSTAFDVTEAGVQSLAYLSFDGVDDHMTTTVDTNTIFGAAGGADPGYLLVGGVRYNAAGASASAFARSAFCGDSGGYFGMWAHTINGGEAGLYQWDTTAKTAERPYSVGSSAVLTGRRNPSEGVAGKIYASVNGTSSAGTDAAALNANSGPFQVGRQFGNTFINGQIYSLIARGALTNTTAITDTETWVAGKTGINIANSISSTIFARDDTAVMDRANSIIERRAV